MKITAKFIQEISILCLKHQHPFTSDINFDKTIDNPIHRKQSYLLYFNPIYKREIENLDGFVPKKDYFNGIYPKNEIGSIGFTRIILCHSLTVNGFKIESDYVKEGIKMNRFIRICKYFVDRYESKLKAKRLADESNIKLQAKAEMSSFVEQKGEAFKVSLEEQKPILVHGLGYSPVTPKPAVIEELSKYKDNDERI